MLRYLLAKYKAHINVEVIGSVGAVKYLFKYITKGQDRVMVEKQIDEIQEHINCSWYGDTNSFWRLFEFKLNEMQPSVQKLAIHLPGQQCVTYDPEKVQTEEQLRHVMENQERTTLTSFFELNQRDPEANKYLYPDILRHYSWVRSSNKKEEVKTFKKRTRRCGYGEISVEDGLSNQLGRIPIIVPGRPERDELYYLRLLLHHVPGPKGFDDLKTVTLADQTSKVCNTFRQACVERGLCEGDNDAREAIEEASTIQNGRSLRHFFVTLVGNGMVGDPLALWQEFEDTLSEDRKDRPLDAKATPAMINKALMEIKEMFEDLGIDMARQTKLPEPDMTRIPNQVPRELQEELDRCEAAEDQDPDEKVNMMNSGQRRVFNEILTSVETNSGGLFALDAPGGTGKTFLLTALLEKVRAQGKVAVPTAYTGIAAILLPGGRTLHSRLKIPVGDNLHEETILGFTNHKSGTRALMEQASLLIIDEATMMERNILLAINRTLKHVRGSDKPFGGLTLVISGDWRQTLPVIPRANRAHLVSETLKGINYFNCLILFKFQTFGLCTRYY